MEGRKPRGMLEIPLVKRFGLIAHMSRRFATNSYIQQEGLCVHSSWKEDLQKDYVVADSGGKPLILCQHPTCADGLGQPLGFQANDTHIDSILRAQAHTLKAYWTTWRMG